jgi:DNA-binding XRE family transcriptional regulator
MKVPESKFQFIPFEFPSSQDGKFFIGLDNAGVLRSRREQLGFSQQEVADRAGIKLPQYQRLEAGTRQLDGCSMRIGLAICAVLLLDPYTMVGVTANPPDPSTMKPQRTVDIHEVETCP